MIQELFVVLLFLTAVGYLGRLVFRSFRSRSCEAGCGKCSAVDFSKLEQQLKEKGI